MTTPKCFLVAVLLLAPVAVGCGKKEEQPAAVPPATQAAAPAAAPTRPGSPTPGSRPTQTAVATAMPVPPAARAASSAGLAGSATMTAPASTQAAHPATVPPTAAPVSPPPLSIEAKSPPPTPAPAPRPTTRPQPKAKITLPAKLGAVTFDHRKHADDMGLACTRCHHPSRPQKPLVAEQQACRGCHTLPPTPPMKTSLQGAFHDPKATAGTCIDCHQEAAAKGRQAPVKCLECHKKGQT